MSVEERAGQERSKEDEEEEDNDVTTLSSSSSSIDDLVRGPQVRAQFEKLASVSAEIFLTLNTCCATTLFLRKNPLT